MEYTHLIATLARIDANCALPIFCTGDSALHVKGLALIIIGGQPAGVTFGEASPIVTG